MYTLREKPQTLPSALKGDDKVGDDDELKGLLGLPEEETELDVSDFYLTYTDAAGELFLVYLDEYSS